MKRNVLIMLSVLVIAMFIVGCGTEEAGDFNEDDLVPEDLPAELMEEEGAGINPADLADDGDSSGALAGHAFSAKSVSITPKEVKPGETIEFKIMPGNDKYYYGARIMGNEFGANSQYQSGIKLCDLESYKCKGDTTAYFTVPGSWIAGEYYLKIYVYGGQGWYKSYFNVISGTPPELKKTIVNLNPAELFVGEKLNVEITPGTHGIYQILPFYKKDGVGYKYTNQNLKPCDTFVCFESYSEQFQIPAGWEGEYAIGIWHKDNFPSWTHVKHSFMVKEKVEEPVKEVCGSNYCVAENSISEGADCTEDAQCKEGLLCELPAGSVSWGQCEFCEIGETGKSVCVQENGYWYYKKELINSNCELTTNESGQWCGYGNGKCDDGKGCCKEEYVSSSCETAWDLKNTTMNSCTGTVSDEIECQTLGDNKICYEEEGLEAQCYTCGHSICSTFDGNLSIKYGYCGGLEYVGIVNGSACPGWIE